MEWINISKIDEYEVSGVTLLFWQENISDSECSRFQRGVYLKSDKMSFVRIYPNMSDSIYIKEKEYKEYDLEGDLCQLTHFAFVIKPTE